MYANNAQWSRFDQIFVEYKVEECMKNILIFSGNYCAHLSVSLVSLSLILKGLRSNSLTWR